MNEMIRQKLSELRALKLPNTEILEVSFVAENTPTEGLAALFGTAPAHILVKIASHPEEGSNIRSNLVFQPTDWNGRLFAFGNGGFAGTVSENPHTGALRMGYAVVMTDLGTSAGPDCGIESLAARKDFGYRANHEMAFSAKEILGVWFGRKPHHSYYVGGSTGGQQGLSIAQRYPEDFDGILAGAPAHDRVNLHLGFLWDYLAFLESKEEPFTQEDAFKITEAMLSRKAAEGEKDPEGPFFLRPDKIQVTRDVFDGLGFSEKKINALMKMYEGPHDPVTGERIYEGTMIPGSETQGLGLVSRSDASFPHDFFYLFRWVLGADFDFTTFDFHRDTMKLREVLGRDLDAVNTDLSAFKARGGKLLIAHGTADPIIPCTSSIRYYRDVQKKMGDTSDFFRLFLMPGMAHVGGGPGVQDYIYGIPATPKDRLHFGLETLVSWVEEGIAPDYITPVHFKEGPMDFLMPEGIVYERIVKPFEVSK